MGRIAHARNFECYARKQSQPHALELKYPLDLVARCLHHFSAGNNEAMQSTLKHPHRQYSALSCGFVWPADAQPALSGTRPLSNIIASFSVTTSIPSKASCNVSVCDEPF